MARRRTEPAALIKGDPGKGKTMLLCGIINELKQQPSLISYVQKKYDAVGNPLFRDVNAWVALLEVFTDILEDLNLPPTRLVIDVLDECVEGLKQLLDLIVQTSSVYPGVKWIVSSHNWPGIGKYLGTATQKLKLSLELNEESVSTAITTYIRFKVDRLTERSGYSNDIREVVQRYLSANAHGTFL
ncbi:beta transducin-like protein HET-D2Y [Corynascus novoguineensis]|uniref:Beta transducin-like protein HET-D2Y n=1 Tax=Corynascus novoguineensis TaxID=1126955 RepID=A0AAN7HD51_9PEZI|nr:beta transducin-like protein HET-D2Y [Corynascus novoguineensis]